MSNHKLSDLPDFEVKQIALEVQRIGLEMLGGRINSFPDVMIIGLVKIVADLTLKVAELEGRIK
jgi:hypothetical protein